MTAHIVLGISNLSCGILFAILSIPLVKGWVRMNRFYGIRFKKSFESDENWYKINKYGGKRMIVWSMVLMALGLTALLSPFDENQAVVILLAFAPSIMIVPALESYFYARSL
jgi:hypothetical protein